MINRALVPQWPSASFVGEMAGLQSIPRLSAAQNAPRQNPFHQNGNCNLFCAALPMFRLNLHQSIRAKK
jgi:hypothetical protein